MAYKSREFYESQLSNGNVIAMLNSIAVAEGCGEHYGCSFGGRILTLSGPRHPYSGYDCSMNPNAPRAVGRYQFCGKTWDEINRALGGLDFSNPRHQDIGGVARIDIRGSLQAVIDGRVEDALRGTGGRSPSGYPSGLAYEWASMPPFRYGGQGTKTMSQFIEIFKSFNGKPLPSGNASADSFSNLATAASSVSGGLGIGGARRQNCPEWNRSMRQGKILTGCDMAGVIGFGGSSSIAPGATQGTAGAAGNADLVSVPIDVADLQGKLLWPLRTSSGAKGGIKTSSYGWRIHPTRGGRRFHAGIDLSRANNIVAAAPGVVVFSGNNPGGYGYYVVIEHGRPNGKIWTLYAHLRQMGAAVGTQVQAGTGIGLEGSTGASTGQHLHFEVRTTRNGGQGGTVDPWPLIDQTR